MIVVSILLAFGIDAWWGRQQERERLDAALRNLEAGLIENLSHIDEELERVESFRQSLRLFLEAEPEELVRLAPVDLTQMAQALSRPGVGPLNAEEVLALMDDTSLRDLDAGGFRAATAGWRERWRIVLDRHGQLYEVTSEEIRVYARDEATRRLLDANFEAGEEHGQLVVSARGEQDIVSMASVKEHHLRVLSYLYGELRMEAELVLDEIRAEVDR